MTKVESGGSLNRIIKFDKDGTLVDEFVLAAQAGFVPGVVVKRTKDGHAGIIKEAGGGKMVLLDLKKKFTEEVTFAEFRDHWTIVMGKEEITDSGTLVNYRETLADNNEPLGLLRKWSSVQMALESGQAWIEEFYPHPDILVSQKPSKKVFLQCDAQASPFKSTRGT